MSRRSRKQDYREEITDKAILLITEKKKEDPFTPE